MSNLDESPAVRCQRCGRPGGTVAYGWAILCSRCMKDDTDWMFD